MQGGQSVYQGDNRGGNQAPISSIRTGVIANHLIPILTITFNADIWAETPPRQAGDRRPPPFAEPERDRSGRPTGIVRHAEPGKIFYLNSATIRADALRQSHRQYRSSRKPRRAHNRERARLRGELPQAAAAHPRQGGLGPATPRSNP